MMHLAHSNGDCKGHKVLKYSLWHLQTGKNATFNSQQGEAEKSDEWGFIICSPSIAASVAGEPGLISLCGVVGSIRDNCIQNSSYGIQIAGSDSDKALSIFSLACGLSVIENAVLEIGDNVVVAGANVLALKIIEAATLQGVRTMCLVPDAEAESACLPAIQKIAGVVIGFKFDASFDSEIEAFEKSTHGKTIYIDAAGIPNLIHYMTTRLKMFGGLVLCRQDSAAYFPLDIYRDVHRKSAWIHYWNINEGQVDNTRMSNFCKRAARLYENNRVIVDANLPIKFVSSS